MPVFFEQNRRDLHRLIATTPMFTEAQLVEKFREGRDSILIHGNLSIGNYLGRLRDVGVLRYDSGLYYHPGRI